MVFESPEVISARMYAGPGSGSLLAAAAAWGQLAGELGSAATGYQAVIAELTAQGWLGPSAEAMAAAATPYIAWLTSTAAQAERAATQASAAASAFTEAHAAVVPPPLIAANRSQLVTLVATNLLGQNTAAIAATEAEYAAMWIQDMLAMTGYSARSAGATTLTPFRQPPWITNPAGLGAQGATLAGTTHTQLSQLITAIPQALRGITPAVGAPAALAAAAPLQATTPSLTQLVSYVGLASRSIVPFNDAIKTILYGMVQNSRNLTTASDEVVAGRATATESASQTETLAADTAQTGTEATAGTAGTVGKLSVPSGWMEAAPEIKLAATASATSGAAAAPAGADALPAGIFADMALAGLLGRSIGGTAPQTRPAAIMNGRAQSRLERMVDEIAGTHDVQHWHTDPSRLDSLLEELSQKPGVHAVHVNNDGQNAPPTRPRAT